MVKSLRIVFAAAVVLYAVVCSGETKTDSRLVQALLDKSGLSKQLEQMPELLEAGMAEANEETEALSPESLSQMSAMTSRVFDPGRLLQSIQMHIEANLSEEDTRHALAWLESPLGEKILRLEEKAATPEGYAEMLKMAEQLVADTTRLELIRKLDTAVKATESGVSMVLNTQTALIAALTSDMQPETRPSIDAIESEVRKNRQQVEAQVEAQTLVMFLYSYRELTDADIGEYLKFAESGPGRKYHAVVNAGFDRALAAAAHQLGYQIDRSAGRKVHTLRRKNSILL